MKEVADAMNKVNKLSHGLDKDAEYFSELNSISEALKRRVIELNTKSK